jgi:hypothetical protein
MAKFYQRYIVPRVDQTVLYGYSDDNLIVNGQFYTASTGLQQVGNFQCFPVVADCSCQIAPIHTVSIFEPGFYANSFDLAGGRFSEEHAANTYLTYGTNRDINTRWTFKNHVQGYSGSRWSTSSTSAATACLRGCVLAGACTDPVFSVDTCFISTVQGCAIAPSIPVRTQCDTLKCFVPMTSPVVQFTSNCQCQTSNSSTAHSEPSFGDTVCTYRACCTARPCTTGSTCPKFSPFCFCNFCSCNSPNFTTSGSYNFPTLNGISDQMIFGACCMCWICVLNNGCCTIGSARTTIHGAYPIYDDPKGAIENGVRVFLAGNDTYTFYLYFNAQVGGIQGSDTATSLVERMQLRVLNSDTSATTTLATWKKGIGGFVIPSNPDLSNETSYRFYMITFNGADTATQTISILRPTLNLASGTTTVGSAYALASMTAAQQQALYADLGYNNTGVGVLENANFRRHTTNRIWISTDGNGIKRLHLGVYNTNGDNLITVANNFNNPSLRGSIFKIWSWALNDGTTTATFLGSTDLATYGPRYFCPLNDDWTVIYAGASFTNDIVLTLNQTTGLYQYQNTMPYVAARLFKDADGRWAVQVEDVAAGNGIYDGNYIDIITSSVGQTLVISASTISYIYAGTTINGNVTVNVYNYLGERVAKTVSLTVVGPTASPGITFANDEYTTTVTTSTSADTTVAIKVISAASAKIVGTVSE